ncbi:MAG: DUF2066 domain-containing protein [Rhodanobacter sp.]
MDAGSAIGQTACFTHADPTLMRLYRLLLVALLLALTGLSALHAQGADASPYIVVVPVPDTSAAQRSDAFAIALGQVLTRVAGGQDLRSKSGYADALQGAGAMVQKFQYQRVPGGMSLEVNFEPGAVKRLVAKLGVPAASAKPPVLLLVRGSDGVLFDQSALTRLAAVATARGTSVAYPQADEAVDTGKVAAGDPAALAAINQRYHTGLVLVGSMHDGRAQWTFVSGGKAQQWSAQGSTEDALLADAGRALVQRVGKQLNVVGASVSEGKFWVGGLHSALDYANLLSTLRADPAVRRVATLGGQDDGVLLSVQAALPLDGLAASLAAGGRLLVESQPHAGADVTLRWAQ